MRDLAWKNLGVRQYEKILEARGIVLLAIENSRQMLAFHHKKLLAEIGILDAIKAERNSWGKINFADFIPEVAWLDHEIHYREATAKPRHRA